jgi:threonine dehydrogenase-like Zn-dependent dehydrogenase
MWCYPEETKEALRLIADGRVNRDILISRTFPLQDVKEGFEIQGDPDASVEIVILND